MVKDGIAICEKVYTLKFKGPRSNIGMVKGLSKDFTKEREKKKIQNANYATTANVFARGRIISC